MKQEGARIEATTLAYEYYDKLETITKPQSIQCALISLQREIDLMNELKAVFYNGEFCSESFAYVTDKLSELQEIKTALENL